MEQIKHNGFGANKERRLHQRYELYMPIRVRSLDHGSAGNDELSCTVNISAAGLYYLSELRWKPMERCEVTIWTRVDGDDADDQILFRSAGIIMRTEDLPMHEFARPWEEGVAVRLSGFFKLK